MRGGSARNLHPPPQLRHRQGTVPLVGTHPPGTSGSGNMCQSLALQSEFKDQQCLPLPWTLLEIQDMGPHLRPMKEIHRLTGPPSDLPAHKNVRSPPPEPREPARLCRLSWAPQTPL